MQFNYGILTNLDGKVKVMARFSNTDDESGTCFSWSRFQEVTLNIVRRQYDLPRAKNPGDFKGNVILIVVEDFCWADYGHHSYCDNNLWKTEEFNMEVIEVIN